jgi:hypothetical protein
VTLAVLYLTIAIDGVIGVTLRLTGVNDDPYQLDNFLVINVVNYLVEFNTFTGG